MVQSIHTTVYGPKDDRIPNSDQGHGVAEYGVAALWAYKEGEAVQQRIMWNELD